MKSVCGLDVHKDSVYLCILSEFGELIEKVFYCDCISYENAIHVQNHIAHHCIQK